MPPFAGNINVSAPTDEIIGRVLPRTQPASTVKVGIPVYIIVDMVADAVVNSVQNPMDSDCLVTALVNVVTVDATETVDIGVDSDGTTTDDTIVDGLAISVAGVFASTESPGTNGGAALLDKKGGTNDFLVFTNSAGTDVIVGTILFILYPLGT